MKLLVLGGTVFVGRHFVELALERGHEITLLHRGQRGADLFPDVDRVLTDRDGGLDALGDRTWDAVMDSSGYVPRIVGGSAEFLRDRVRRYLFVSTISVYARNDLAHQDESGELASTAGIEGEEVNGKTYGPLKVLCEQEVTGRYGDRSTIVRPGLIAGPYDPTNRFPYWVERLADGGSVLVPERLSQPLQMIDGRDLAAFMLDLLERDVSGVFNATGPQPALTFGDMLAACPHQAQLVPTTEAFLEQHGIELWQELPLASPAAANSDGLMQMDVSKALAEGMRLRPWAETARDTLEWVRAEPDRPRRHGLDRDKERLALAAM
jgi:2'-hydroxyisoflavone reductase